MSARNQFTRNQCCVRIAVRKQGKERARKCAILSERQNNQNGECQPRFPISPVMRGDQTDPQNRSLKIIQKAGNPGCGFPSTTAASKEPVVKKLSTINADWFSNTTFRKTAGWRLDTAWRPSPAAASGVKANRTLQNDPKATVTVHGSRESC